MFCKLSDAKTRKPNGRFFVLQNARVLLVISETRLDFNNTRDTSLILRDVRFIS